MTEVEEFYEASLYNAITLLGAMITIENYASGVFHEALAALKLACCPYAEISRNRLGFAPIHRNLKVLCCLACSMNSFPESDSFLRRQISRALMVH